MKKTLIYVAYTLCQVVCLLSGCTSEAQKKEAVALKDIKMDSTHEVITLGAGCFWCVEAVFQRLEGVDTVLSGYSGGQTVNPTYKDICTGTTGHAEVVQVHFNPAVLPLDKLLYVFFNTHDPTTLNRQGADEGTQYRSVIFYHNEKQKVISQAVIQKLSANNTFESPIVTQIAPFTTFYPAENYHQNYYNLNGEQPYCKFVIDPKVQKLNKLFPALVK